MSSRSSTAARVVTLACASRLAACATVGDDPTGQPLPGPTDLAVHGAPCPCGEMRARLAGR